MPNLNVELLQKVKAHILEEPKRLEMQKFAEPSEESPCGTVACIAGWSAILDRGLRYNANKDEWLFRNNRVVDDIEGVAAKSLGINYRDAISLFYLLDWPNDLYARYYMARTQQKRAEITAERIDRFIAVRVKLADNNTLPGDTI